jgi:hypothetical protein
MEMRFSVAPKAIDFPPLPAPAVAVACPPVSRCEVRVGSMLIPLVVSPEPVVGQVVAALVLGTEQQGPPVCGDVDAGRPLVEAVVVDPAGQSQLHQGDAASVMSGPFLVQSRPSSSSAQTTHPTALLKWAWRPVGTLDPSLLIPTPFSDLVRANLLHLTVLAPQISRSALLLAMDRSRREGRDGWDGRAGSKRSFEESLPLEERRVDMLSESELRLLLECRERVGYRSPVRMLEGGHFDGDSSRFPQGQNYPRAGEGNLGP